MEEKMPLSQKLCAFRCLNSRPQLRSRIQFKCFSEKLLFFLKNYTTSEGAVSDNVLCYQHLCIARYQVSSYANNYFE